MIRCIFTFFVVILQPLILKKTIVVVRFGLRLFRKGMNIYMFNK